MTSNKQSDLNITHNAIPVVLAGSPEAFNMDARYVNVVDAIRGSQAGDLFDFTGGNNGGGEIHDKPELSDIEFVSKSTYFDPKTNTTKARLIFKIRNSSGQNLLGIDARLGDLTGGTLSFTTEPTVAVSATSAVISWGSAGQDSYTITGLDKVYSGTLAQAINASPLLASTQYTAVLTIQSATGDMISRTLTFNTGTITAATITQIVATNGGSGTPFMKYQITGTNVLSGIYTIYRRATASSTWLSSGPYTVTFVNNVLTVLTNSGGAGYEYYIAITPYPGLNLTGTAGVPRISSNKTNFTTVTNLTNNY
jgi:hypothetical protein